MSEIRTRLPCTAETRADLRSMKSGGERYEDVLRRLIREHRDND